MYTIIRIADFLRLYRLASRLAERAHRRAMERINCSGPCVTVTSRRPS